MVNNNFSQINKKQISISPIIFIFVLGYLFIGLTRYNYTTEAISRVLIVGILMLGLYYLTIKKADITKPFKIFILFYVYYLFTSLINIISIHYFVVTCILGTLFIYSPIFIYMFAHNLKDRQKIKLINCLLIIWMILAFSSIIVFSQYEHGGRAFAVEGSQDILIAGGYTGAYGSSLVAVFLLNFLLSRDKEINKFSKILSIITFVVCVVHVFLTFSAITTISMVSGLILSILFHGKKTSNTKYNSKSFILFFICFILFLFFIFNIRNIGLALIGFAKNISSDVYSQRLRELGNYLAYSQENYHATARIETILTPINTFFKNPLFGIGYKYGNSYDLLAVNGVGMHSDLFDSFAQFGIIGGFLRSFLFVYGIVYIGKTAKFKVGIPLFVTFILMFSFNPFISVQTNFIIFLLLPLFAEAFGEIKEKI